MESDDSDDSFEALCDYNFMVRNMSVGFLQSDEFDIDGYSRLKLPDIRLEYPNGPATSFWSVAKANAITMYLQSIGLRKITAQTITMMRYYIENKPINVNPKGLLPVPMEGEVTKRMIITTERYERLAKDYEEYKFSDYSDALLIAQLVVHLAPTLYVKDGLTWSDEHFIKCKRFWLKYVNLFPIIQIIPDKDLPYIFYSALCIYTPSRVYESILRLMHEKKLPESFVNEYREVMKSLINDTPEVISTDLSDIKEQLKDTSVDLYDDGAVKITVTYNECPKQKLTTLVTNHLISKGKDPNNRTQRKRIKDVFRKRLFTKERPMLNMTYNSVALGHYDYHKKKFFVNPGFQELYRYKRHAETISGHVAIYDPLFSMDYVRAHGDDYNGYPSDYDHIAD